MIGLGAASLMRVSSVAAPERSPERHRREMEEVNDMVEVRGLKERGLVGNGEGSGTRDGGDGVVVIVKAG